MNKSSLEDKVAKFNPAPSSSINYKGQMKGANETFNFLHLIDGWEIVVGPILYKYTRPLKHKNKTLTVMTSHPAFSQQLQLMGRTIIEKISQHFPLIKGKINEIIFQTTPSFFENLEKEKIQKLEGKSKTLHSFHPETLKTKHMAKEFLNDLPQEDKAGIEDILESLYIQFHN